VQDSCPGDFEDCRCEFGNGMSTQNLKRRYMIGIVDLITEEKVT